MVTFEHDLFWLTIAPTGTVSVSALYCIPQCVRLIAGGGVRVGSGVHGSYTFPVQTDGVFWHRHQIEGTNGF